MSGHHHHIDPNSGNTRIFWAITVNILLTVVQIIGGILSGSLALIADAIHNMSDALSLILAFVARKIAQRPADDTMTFGYGRAEIVAALINYTTLILLGLYLTYEAVVRLFNPASVDGWLVVVIAFFALLVDAATALLTYALSKQSMNIRAAFLHNVADALGSVAVIIAGTVIILYDWRLIDPLITLVIAGYILWQSVTEIGGAVRILMLGSPPDLDTRAILKAIRTVSGVEDVHHLHLWQMQEHESAVDAHIVIKAGVWTEADRVKLAVKDALRDGFGLSHITLELECHVHACKDPQEVGHIVAN
ncbi:cation diffusion facilitator family transporter [Falsihalocynthiibacter arcticus]|uniref:Cation diffusion facilitator family transporter n=1 Tax=Falsihalocynthiibacter arcticus TaxID=1579316 RepID=A0A126V5A0_9RHOB|nr:cation diffusion facilitator family transporter [Falsihalocynthiibacter arcticus]AML53480.1 cation diffusion facilitator family transporter [Falsihalocynthiibacter arcticus]